MSDKKAGANASVAVDDLRDDIAATREELGQTAGALADKADVKAKARQVKARGQEAAEQVGESARRHPMRWGTVVAGILAGIAAIGAMRWRKARQTPKSRAKRAWRDAKSRVREAKGRLDIAKDRLGDVKDRIRK